MDYWESCVSEAFEDAKISATKEQIDTVISWVEGCHENYGMAHGHDDIPSPVALERDDAVRELKKERDKTKCPNCGGLGYEGRKLSQRDIDHMRYGPEPCYKCRGAGRI